MTAMVSLDARLDARMLAYLTHTSLDMPVIV